MIFIYKKWKIKKKILIFYIFQILKIYHDMKYLVLYNIL